MEIGQQVVCVSCPDERNETYLKYPGFELVVGAIYTIRDIDRRTEPYYGVPTIRLQEIIGPTQQNTKFGPWEVGYSPRRFRPLSRTDISTFTNMVRELDLVGG